MLRVFFVGFGHLPGLRSSIPTMERTHKLVDVFDHGNIIGTLWLVTFFDDDGKRSAAEYQIRIAPCDCAHEICEDNLAHVIHVLQDAQDWLDRRNEWYDEEEKEPELSVSNARP